MSFFFPHNRTISLRLMNKLRIQNTMKNGLNRYSRKSFPSVRTKSLRNGWNILPPNQNRVLKPTFYKIFSTINYCSPCRFEYNKIRYLKFISTKYKLCLFNSAKHIIIGTDIIFEPLTKLL